MTFPSSFLSAVSKSGICAANYSLCREHPLRLDIPLAKAPASAVLKVATGQVSLTKLGGPGTVFQLNGLPDEVSLNFIIQGRSSVETDFAVPFGNEVQRGTFASLCNAATVAAGLAAPNPPYPRPDFRSIEELVTILSKFEALVRKLGAAANGR
ncbi:hypothetical protein [Xanthomonas axonopodis]|uniref:hypothetical protein n=1 Tax=Xanthomonas axonopodis TaxID=53413 RepID=UPI0011179017|nr:hypothetical protein [Xanthomonas axonopodis]